MKLRILIVDDQKTVRESIKAFLAEVVDFELVGTAVDGYEVIAKAKELKPEIILMDIEMPGLDGLEATKSIIQHDPQIKILILTSHDHDDLIAKSLSVGAEGYLLKNMSSTEIIRAIRFVSQGYTKVQPSLGISVQGARSSHSNAPLINIPLNASPASPLTIKNNNADSLRLATPNEFLPPIKTWLVISGLACLSIFVGAIALASVLKYKVTVKAPAKVRPLGEVRLVQAVTKGKIASILVRENQTVREGELIARLDNTVVQSQKQQLLARIQQTKQQLKQLNEQIILIQAQIAAEQDLQQLTLVSARTQLQHQQHLYQEQLTTVRARLVEAGAAVELAQEEFNRYQKLAETGIISQLQLREKTAAVKISLAKLQQVKATLDPSQGEVAMAREQIAQSDARGKTTLASLNREQQQLIAQKIELANQLNNYQEDLKQIATTLENTYLRAPLAGTIQTLNLRNPGQVVRSGDEIATIAPSNSALIIKAFVSSGDIGKVEVGQTTQMRVSACSYSDFGTLEGKVISVSADTKDLAQTTASYEISIEPEVLNLKADDRRCNIRLGMEGRADIISDEETVLQFLLRKIKLIGN